MFTGIIQGQGELIAIQPSGNETRLSLRTLWALENIQSGESIAVNGVCLTVEHFGSRTFTAYASAETMFRTNLGLLRMGSLVNTERALALGDRLGGHLVSGHVDCTATVRHVVRAGQSHCVRMSFDPDYGREIVPKGSITLDGISLTVNACGPDFLEVNIIPETWRSTTAAHWQPGALVNMETDIIAKYVRRMLTPWTEGNRSPETATSLTEDFLRQHGFF